MKLLVQSLLLSSFLIVLLNSCSEKIEPKPSTYSQLLTGTEKKSWRLVSSQTVDNGRPGSVTPTLNEYDPCIADDLYTFYANDEHKLEISEGATKCSAGDPDIYITDNWTLINADASLEFAFPIIGLKYPFTIKNLTATVLTIEFYFPDINASYRYTFNSTTSK